MKLMLTKNSRVVDVTNDSVLAAHLTSKGWALLPSLSTGGDNLKGAGDAERNLPTLGVQNTKAEILEVMEAYNLPCRPDMTKEALLTIYHQHTTPE